MIESFKNIPVADMQYPFEFIESSRALILEQDEHSVTIGYTDNTEKKAIETIENYHQKKTTFIKLPEIELTAWISRTFSSNEEINESKSIDKLEDNATIVNFVNSILLEGIKRKASDIHIEANDGFYTVRFRIDGYLKIYSKYYDNRFDEISARIKIMANLNVMEKRKPQDGRITVSLEQKKIDLRISVVPTTNGESIVLRILLCDEEAENSFKKLENLGFSKNDMNNIRRMLKVQHGLILVTGPTGSGKTTTMTAMLREILNSEIKIITIEDPVEISLPGVNQIQVNDQIDLTFESVLRRVLRQDPDVIMVGEIRDERTARLCVRSALTGHLVLSTLHTNDSVGTITRLINMGIEPYIVGTVLKGAIAQRLVKKNDGHGRTVIGESFVMSKQLEEAISSNCPESVIRKTIENCGFKSMKEDAESKIKKHLTSIEYVEKELLIS